MQDSEIHGDWQRILSDKDLKVYEDAIRQLSAHHKHSSASLGLHTKAKTLFEKLRHEDCVGTLEYFNAGELDVEVFTRDFVRTGKPAMIRGLDEHPGCSTSSEAPWPARTKWAGAETFVQNRGDIPFRLTELAPLFGMGKPLPVRIPLGIFLAYAASNQADYPWYAFGDDFEGQREALARDYTVPAPFREDVYALTPETRACFPRYRYMVIGGPRSGSNMHVDPRWTAAWNTLLCGLKRWVLFPPGTDRGYLDAMGLPEGDVCMGKVASPPMTWWLEKYPRLKESGMAKELGMIECLQRPGDTIYVPAGWWHAVLNVETSVAVTQNLLAPSSLPLVWDAISREDRLAARAIREALLAEGREWVGIGAGEIEALLERGCGQREGDDEGDVVAMDPRSGEEGMDGRTAVVLAGGHVVYV